MRGERLEPAVSKLRDFFRLARRTPSVPAASAPGAPSAPSRNITEERLRIALERGEFELLYQPITEIKTGLIVGAEALLRWRDPATGVMLPTEFIPLAEDSGLIIQIGEWVLHTACRQLKEFHDAGFLGMKMSVNVSAKQFESLDLPATVATALRRAHMGAEYLQLEFTETTAMKNPEQAYAIMNRLHETGTKLAIDDFGTGYSSLAALKHFPLDELKIDRSFVKNCTNDPDDAAIVMAVISLARGMGLRSVAEGVETERQLEYLRTLQCDAVQGFLRGAAMTPEAFVHLLRGNDNPFDSIAALP